MRYAIFLRAVNVGGNWVNMKELCSRLEAAGMLEVSSYKQSGNLLLSSPSSEEAVEAKVRGVLKAMSGKDFEVFVRNGAQMKAILRLAPFAKSRLPEAKRYILFLQQPLPKTELPLKSPKGDATLLLAKGREAYAEASAQMGTGGAPAQFLEKHFKVKCSGRNWLTVTAVTQLF